MTDEARQATADQVGLGDDENCGRFDLTLAVATSARQARTRVIEVTTGPGGFEVS